MYYGARYYAADLGRFLQPDTLIPHPYNPQSLNRYSYVLNNPVKYTDPTGHEADCGDDCEEDDTSAPDPELPIETDADEDAGDAEETQRDGEPGDDLQDIGLNRGGLPPICGQEMGSRICGGGGPKPPWGGWRGPWFSGGASRGGKPGLSIVQTNKLPVEAQATITNIRNGGPFPYPKNDGQTFKNLEGLLPSQKAGYYQEYTVPTPGISDRGAQRIVTGMNGEMYYTNDHYGSFVEVR